VGQELIRPAVSRDAFGDARLREAYDWIHNSFWLEPVTSKVKRLPEYFKLVEDIALNVTRTLMLVEGFVGLVSCALETAGRLRRHSPAIGDRLQLEAFASGAASASALRDIAARADDYYRDVLGRSIEQAQGKKSEVRVPRLADTIAQAPGWTDAYLALSRQLGSRPEAATDLLRFTELDLLERFLVGRDPRLAEEQFIRSNHRWLSGAVSLAAGFCERVWRLEDPMFSALRQAQPIDSSAEGQDVAPQASLLPGEDAAVVEPDA
jgi:hypothetical protein